MPEKYSLGSRISFLYEGEIINKILEEISGEDSKGIDVMADNGASRFYPESKLTGIRVKSVKMEGIEDICVRINEEVLRT